MSSDSFANNAQHPHAVFQTNATWLFPANLRPDMEEELPELAIADIPENTMDTTALFTPAAAASLPSTFVMPFFVAWMAAFVPAPIAPAEPAETAALPRALRPAVAAALAYLD